MERGDCASVAKTIRQYKNCPAFDINCLDPLGRSALSITIINENPEMMELLLHEGIKMADALLLAISEEYVEGVEILLLHEEKYHLPGTIVVPTAWLKTLLGLGMGIKDKHNYRRHKRTK